MQICSILCAVRQNQIISWWRNGIVEDSAFCQSAAVSALRVLLAFVQEKFYHPDPFVSYNLFLWWNMFSYYLWYHSENIYPATSVFSNRHIVMSDCYHWLPLCVFPLPAGSQPPGTLDRLPPQVTGLLHGDQKLPRPPQAAHLLHPGAEWALQPRHGRHGPSGHRGEMSAGGPGRTPPSPQAHIHGPLLTHAFLLKPGVSRF